MRQTVRVVVLVALVAAAGAAAALLVGAAMGMSGGDLARLVLPLAVATAVTVAATVAANAALTRTSLRYRFLIVAVLGAVVALANLAVMAKLMMVSSHDLALALLAVDEDVLRPEHDDRARAEGELPEGISWHNEHTQDPISIHLHRELPIGPAEPIVVDAYPTLEDIHERQVLQFMNERSITWAES